jgi:hypothetical protein
MPNHSANSPADPPPPAAEPSAGLSVEISHSDGIDEAVIKLAAQAAFLQAFAENVIDEERPIEEIAPRARGGEIDFGWRAGLHW